MLGDCIPFDLIVLVHLPLGVVADDLDIDEAAQIELFRSELRHNGGSGLRWD